MSKQGFVTKGDLSCQNSGFNRREMLIGMGGLAAVAISGTAFAAEKGKQETPEHAKGKGEGLIDAVLQCLKKGLICTDHCIETFKTGDTSIAVATEILQETLVLCNALLYVASYNSRYLKGFTKVCIEAFTDCERECRKHEKRHITFKEAADACAKCIEECKKVA